MRTLVRSPAHEVRLQAAVDFVVQTRPGQEIILVAASAHAARGLVRRVTARTGATVGLRGLTLRQFALRLAVPELARRGLIPISALSRHALSNRALYASSTRDRLQHFSTIADKPGFPGALSRTLEELRRAAIQPTQLTSSAPDLALLLQAYETELQAGALADDAELFSLATHSLGTRSELPEPLLLLDVEVVDARASDFVAALLDKHRRWLSLCPPLCEGVAALATPRATSVGPTAPTPTSALERLQTRLFQTETASADMDPSVTILSAPGEARESVEIARKLLWHAERGVAFDQMAVLSRRAASYSPHLMEAFRRAGIPFYTSTEARRPDPSGRALLALLNFHLEGHSARRLAEYQSLQTPQAQESVAPDRPLPSVPELYPDSVDEAGLEPEDEDRDLVVPGRVRPRAFERLLTDAAVHRGRERFSERLLGLRAELTQRRAALRVQGESDAALDIAIDDVTELRRFALALIDDLGGLPESASLAQWVAPLQGLARRYLRRPGRIESLLAELAPLQVGQGLTLRALVAVLEEPLTQLRQAPSKTPEGQVFIGDANQARGLSFEVVCVPGLCEKVFPERVREDPLLLDDKRRELGQGLLTNRERTAHERLLLALAVGAARGCVVLSYPRLDLERGRPRVPSFYAVEALRAAEGTLLSYAALMRRAERESDSRVGWPAPKLALDAIDDAEHDLAVLSRPLSSAGADSVGAARYLLEVNAHLARALRARARRWTVRKYGQADGLVELGDEAIRFLERYVPAVHAYSVTALEHFAACPYRFYLHSIQGLRERPSAEPVDEMDNAQRGLLIHRSMFETLSQLRDATLLPLTEPQLPDALRILDAVVDRVAEEGRRRLNPRVARVYRDGITRLRADLHAWARRLPHGLTPRHFEFGFGIPSSPELDPCSVQEPVALACGLTLRGAIDVVEEQAGTLRATDHKTGVAKVPVGLRINGGRVLQPLLYGLVARDLFPGASTVEGRLYYATLRGGFEERVVAIDAQAERAAQVLSDALSAAVRHGFFPAAPEDGACERCRFVPVCGPYEEHRTRHKRSDLLQPLQLLRKQP